MAENRGSRVLVTGNDNVGAPAIIARGAIITTGATAASVAIPDTTKGAAPNRVRLAATKACYARLGTPGEGTVAVAAAGSGYVTGETITISGGTATTAMTVTPATAKVISTALNARGSGYLVGQVLTLNGGTNSTKPTITLVTTQLESATLNAAGTGYASGNVITTAATGGTASAHATLNVDTVKLISAAVNAHGTGYAAGDVLTMVGGTGTAATQTVATMDIASAPTVDAAGTGYVPADTIDLAVTGSTASVVGVVTVDTTQVVSATVQAGGTGDLGDGAGVIVQGTTGTGTKFQASVTIASNAIASVQSITLAGAYTANPTNIAVEPVAYVSGASSGTTLTGAVLAVVMGVAVVSLTTPGTYTVGGTVATQGATSGAGSAATFTGVLFGVKTVTLTSAGSYSGTNPTSFTSTVAPAGGTGATFNTVVLGVNTFSVVARGSYTVEGTALTQNGATTPAGGTGATFSAPLYAPLTWSYSNAGNFSVTAAALTQFGASNPAGGTGATFQTTSYGLLTATVVEPGAYTVQPSNPAASTSDLAGINATFTVTWATAAAAGDILIQPEDSMILDAVGFDHISAIQVTEAGILVVSPLEN